MLVYSLPVGLGSSPIAGLSAHSRCQSSYPICYAFTPAVLFLNLHLIICQSPLNNVPWPDFLTALPHTE